jgi:hypothetical protein
MEKRVGAHSVHLGNPRYCRLRSHTKLEGSYPWLRIVFANHLAVHFIFFTTRHEFSRHEFSRQTGLVLWENPELLRTECEFT